MLFCIKYDESSTRASFCNACGFLLPPLSFSKNITEFFVIAVFFFLWTRINLVVLDRNFIFTLTRYFYFSEIFKQSPACSWNKLIYVLRSKFCNIFYFIILYIRLRGLLTFIRL